MSSSTETKTLCTQTQFLLEISRRINDLPIPVWRIEESSAQLMAYHHTLHMVESELAGHEREIVGMELPPERVANLKEQQARLMRGIVDMTKWIFYNCETDMETKLRENHGELNNNTEKTLKKIQAMNCLSEEDEMAQEEIFKLIDKLDPEELELAEEMKHHKDYLDGLQAVEPVEEVVIPVEMKHQDVEEVLVPVDPLPSLQVMIPKSPKSSTPSPTRLAEPTAKKVRSWADLTKRLAEDVDHTGDSESDEVREALNMMNS